MRRRLPALAACFTLLAAAGCQPDREPTQLVLASTTSTQDSGLLDALIPAFEREHPGYDVKVVAVGTGEALELGRRGDADVLLVHAPAAESAFVADGHGLERRPVMHNDFVLIGPPADPAGLRGGGDAAAALRALAAARASFVSRGDDSGTHRKEIALWEAAGIDPQGGWYMDAGQGMGEVLQVASETGAYTLTDRATYLFLRPNLALDILVEGDPRLHNPYGVIPVSGAMNDDGAAAFVRWITSPAARELIGSYGTKKFGQPLFVPDSGG